MLHDAELQEQLNIREQCKELLCLQQKANGMQPMPPSVAAGGITSLINANPGFSHDACSGIQSQRGVFSSALSLLPLTVKVLKIKGQTLLEKLLKPE